MLIRCIKSAFEDMPYLEKGGGVCCRIVREGAGYVLMRGCVARVC